jgi:hypothetical protein
MPQLVTQIILVDQDYGRAYGENKVQAVVAGKDWWSLFRTLHRHPGGHGAGVRQIAVANAARVETRWVSAAAFKQELDKLATIIPDLPARKQKAEENRPWQFTRIDDLMATVDQKLIRLGITARRVVCHDRSRPSPGDVCQSGSNPAARRSRRNRRPRACP